MGQINEVCPTATAIGRAEDFAALHDEILAGMDDDERAAYLDDPYDTFDEMTEADREWLVRPKQRRCGFCLGAHRHAADCVSLCEEWAIRLPFGKFKGQRVRDVDPSYLHWLVKTCIELQSDLKREVYRVLRLPLFEEAEL